jgi:peptidoglycan/LPS O-acetylase OafA/YrhL
MSTPLHRDEMEHEGFATGDALVRGLLGVSITLLVLSQTWRLFDFSTLWWLRPLDGILRSGRTADTMLVAVVGFLAAREMIRRRRESVTAVLRATLTWLLVLTTLVVLGLAAVLVVSQLDSQDLGDPAQVRSAADRILTHQWNLWVIDHPLSVRGDLAGLWPFSALAQLLVGLGVLVLMLGGRPRLLALVLLGCVGASIVWRTATLLVDDDWFAASLHTFGLVDAFAMGAVAAVVVDTQSLTERLSAWGAELFSAAALVLVGLVIAPVFVETTWAIAVIAPTAGLMAALCCAGADLRPDHSHFAVRWFADSTLGAVGAAWASLLLWSQIVIVTVARRAPDQGQWTRVILAGIVILVLVHLTETLLRRILLPALRWRSPAERVATDRRY